MNSYSSSQGRRIVAPQFDNRRSLRATRHDPPYAQTPDHEAFAYDPILLGSAPKARHAAATFHPKAACGAVGFLSQMG